MGTLVVGIGNTLRGDDGAGPFVVELLRAAEPSAGLELTTTQAVLPELAAQLPGHEAVVFVDADLAALEVELSPLTSSGRDGLHGLAPASVVALARRLGFTGEAWLCRVPVQDLGVSEQLSPRAVAAAEEAAALLLGREL